MSLSHVIDYYASSNEICKNYIIKIPLPCDINARQHLPILHSHLFLISLRVSNDNQMQEN